MFRKLTDDELALISRLQSHGRIDSAVVPQELIVEYTFRGNFTVCLALDTISSELYMGVTKRLPTDEQMRKRAQEIALSRALKWEPVDKTVDDDAALTLVAS